MKIKKKHHGKKGVFVFSGFSLELTQQRGHRHHCLKIFWGVWGVARWGECSVLNTTQSQNGDAYL